MPRVLAYQMRDVHSSNPKSVTEHVRHPFLQETTARHSCHVPTLHEEKSVFRDLIERKKQFSQGVFHWTGGFFRTLRSYNDGLGFGTWISHSLSKEEGGKGGKAKARERDGGTQASEFRSSIILSKSR